MATVAAAIKLWETKEEPGEDGEPGIPNGAASDAVWMKLYAQMPPITKMDASLATLSNCERLALSTNAIDRIGSLAGMSKLKILSLGRNVIKKIEKLEDVAGTLEELWISYNNITVLDGLGSCQNLTNLYLSNNQIKNWAELDKLKANPNLRDLLLVGNPIYDEFEYAQCRIEVLKRLPDLAKIDGDMVKPGERDLAVEQMAAIEA